jgi:hypothetical protein
MPQGQWGLWLEQPEPLRSELRRIYCELREEFGLPTRASRRYAKMTAEIWHASEAVSEETAKLAGNRKHGKGRKPTSQKIRLLVKRQSLQANALDTALSKLGALVAKHRATVARLPHRVG